MNKPFLFFLLFLLFCSNTRAQKSPTVVATTDKEKVLLGEKFDLVIGARYTNAASLTFFEVDSLDHFEIVQRSKIDTEKTGQNIVLKQRITLTSFDSGRWQIPAIILPGTNLKTNPVTIDVVFTSPFDPKQEYHDVKEILSVKKPAESNWYWFVIGAVLLVLLLILLFGKKKEVKETVIDVNAYRVAITDLKKLKNEELTDKDVKTFYVRLVDIFRKYLLTGKGIQSFSKTTDDLALQLSKLNLPRNVYEDLVQTLRLSDAVKYAKFSPGSKENDLSIDIIRKTIDSIEKR